jgi:hypothetical protein
LEEPEDDIPLEKTRVLDALSLFASSDQMASIRPDLQPGRYGYLLCEMWFDAVYVPGTRYMDGLKGDRDPAAADAFLALFDEDEERWLERFNRFLELRVDRLSKSDREAGVFPPGERWSSIQRDAGYLIELLGGNPRKGKALEAAATRWLPGPYQ